MSVSFSSSGPVLGAGQTMMQLTAMPSGESASSTATTIVGPAENALEAADSASLSTGVAGAGASSSDLAATKHNQSPPDLTAINEKLASTSYAVQYDTQPGAGRNWLNVVDKTTGQVIYEMPLEAVRKWSEPGNANMSGLLIDSIR